MLPNEILKVMCAQALCAGSECQECKESCETDHCPAQYDSDGNEVKFDHVREFAKLILRKLKDGEKEHEYSDWTEDEIMSLLDL